MGSNGYTSEQKTYPWTGITGGRCENSLYGRYNGFILFVGSGDTAQARVETIIKNGMNGIPASIILGDFKLNNINQSQITTNYEKYGLDLSLLVFPIKWALTPFPPTGSLTNFIKGGHTKINTIFVLLCCHKHIRLNCCFLK